VTAHSFIDELFSRPAWDLASNMRRLTQPQLELLRRLIGEDEEGGALHPGMNGGFVWMPSGRQKYIVAVDAGGRKRTITRLANIDASDAGRLF